MKESFDTQLKEKNEKLKLLILSTVIFLAACQTVPNVPAASTVFPSLPEMQKAPSTWMQEDYIGMMQNYLQGSLPELKDWR